MTGALGRLVLQTLSTSAGSVRARIAPSFAGSMPTDPEAGTWTALPTAGLSEPIVSRESTPAGSVAPTARAPDRAVSRARTGPAEMPSAMHPATPRDGADREPPATIFAPRDPPPLSRGAERSRGREGTDAAASPGSTQEAEPIVARTRRERPIDPSAETAIEPGAAPSPEPLAAALPAALDLLFPAQPVSPPMSAAAAPVAARHEAPGPIEISIGRIEIRADPPRERRVPPPAPRPAPKLMSLDDYLHRGRRR